MDAARECGDSLGGHPTWASSALAEQASLASSSLALGKPSSLAGLAFKPRQRGAFSLSLCLFVLLPQRLLCAQQKLIRLCSWEAFMLMACGDR